MVTTSSLRIANVIFFLLSDENKDDSHLTFGGSSVSFKQGRQLLRQYVLVLRDSTVFVTRGI